MSANEKRIAMVEKHRELVFAAEKYLWAHPQTGFKEWLADAYLVEVFEKLGYTLVRAGNIPGFYTDIETGRPGPKVLIMGELDSLICADHPDCDPETKAVHACGHHAQCAMLVGVAAALKEPGALDGMCGSIRLMAVPAEELIEIGYREELRRQGVIRYFGGKVEFMYRGYMDCVDLAMMVHTGPLAMGGLCVYKGNNGCMAKKVNYKGHAAHAGGAPHKGINALYAASLGLQAVNSLRETFVESDTIRIHPIMTAGGQVVNAIPDLATIESYVRGATIPAIIDANRKVNRALAAGALALGAGLWIEDRPGYMPLNNDPNFNRVAYETAVEVMGAQHVIDATGEWTTGSTDVGDVCSVMPAMQGRTWGAVGTGHGKDYYVTDVEKACIDPAKWMVVTAARLLENDALEAKKIIAEKNPPYPSMAAYFADIDKMYMDKEAVVYNEDGTATIDYYNK